MEDAQVMAAVVAFTQFIKNFGIGSKYIPLVAIVVGGVIGALMSYQNGETHLLGIVRGIGIATVATGLVSTAGDLAKKAKN